MQTMTAQIGPDADPSDTEKVTFSEQNSALARRVEHPPERQDTSPDTLMQALVMAASDPAFDVEKLRTLRELHKEAVDDMRRAAFNEAMTLCQQEIARTPIKANKKNTQTDSMYADLSAVNKVIVPAYTKYGFSVTFGTLAPRIEKHYTIMALVSHKAGFERRYESDIPIDIAGIADKRNKTDVHGFGSTKTYAQRYMLKDIFNLAIEGEDKDGNKPGELVTEEQVTELRKIIADNKLNEAEVLNFLKVEQFQDIYANKFAAAKTVIMQRAKAAQQKK